MFLEFEISAKVIRNIFFSFWFDQGEEKPVLHHTENWQEIAHSDILFE